jgi:hypothetical protein
MSSVVISGDTSGSVTLQAPAVAGTTVLTLPATSGTVITGPGGVVAISGGGTGQTTATAAFNALNPMTTTGDILYESSPTVAARLPIGSTGQVLTVAGGLPSWAAAAAGGFSQMTVYTSPGTFTTPASTTRIKVTVVGGGGGGSNQPAANGGGGGTAIYVGPVSVSTGYAVTVGPGGPGGNGDPGASGGTSSFASLASATGGGGGTPGGAAGNGGAGSAGTLLFQGGAGTPSTRGGNSFLGGSGQTGQGTSGTPYGGGANGGSPATFGGTGAAGVVVVEF